jgi:acyl carrier protein
VLARWPECAVVNGYGPTETTTFACCHKISFADLEKGSVPIGRPINKTTVYILDANRRPVEEGGQGEIYIGGDGVAAGYVNRPELTRERFVPDSFGTEDGASLYRTGDRGLRRADGCIEFLGRLDGQFKINGYRVEPGEVETVLLSHPAVSQAVVTVRSDSPGSKRMVAYVMARDPVSGDDLRAFLATKLPAQMIPSQVAMVESLPLTTNGKIDRSRLPIPPPGANAGARADASIADTVEEIVLEAWRKALGRDEIMSDRNFFDLGGDSLRLMAVHAEVQRVTEREFPLLALLEYPTVGSFTAWLRGGRGKTDPGLAQAGKRARVRREALQKQAQLKQERLRTGANL